MTYIYAQELTQDKREVLIEWLKGEGIEPYDVLDDGKFSVHNGVIAGNKFLTRDGDKVILKNNKIATVHFRQAQKNPLPGVLHEN